MATVTPRLDLDEQIVEQAERAFKLLNGKEPSSFAELMEFVLSRYEDKIISILKECGLSKRQPGPNSLVFPRGRPRRMRLHLWEHLEKISEEYDISRISMLRAALKKISEEY